MESRGIPKLVVGLVSLTLGCGTAMFPTRMTTPARSSPPGLDVAIEEVHLSADVRDRDFSEDTRVLVVF